MSVATEALRDALEHRGFHVKAENGGYRANCPCHGNPGDKRDLDLSFRPGNQGVVTWCHSRQCRFVDILLAVGLSEADGFDNKRNAVYDYGNGHRVYRTNDATSKTGKRIEQYGKPKITNLYPHPDSQPIAEATRVLIVEGEKCADAALKLGAECVTTWPGGTGGVADVDLTPLKGKQVVLIPDKDENGNGLKAMRTLARRMEGIAASVEAWTVPDAYKDIADLYAGDGAKSLLKLGDDWMSDHDGGDDAEQDDAWQEFERKVAEEVERTDIREEARRRRAAREAGGLVIPPLQRLDEFLATEDDPVSFVVEGLLLAGARVVVAAQYKAGKTTAMGNLTRSLADATPFLGQFDVPRAKRVTVLDNEFDDRTMRRWLRDYGIRAVERVRVMSLRGRLRSFDILDDTTRALWAELLRGTEVLVFDCLRPALDALGLDENREAGRFLEALDALAVEAGISEVVVVHHMGHGTERSRGDSRILDWPDATWNLFRLDSDDPSSARFFRAFGRDVLVPEGALDYEDLTRTLTLVEGTRKGTHDDAKVAAAREGVLSHVTAHPGCSGEDLRTSSSLTSLRNFVTRARDELVAEGLIEKRARKGQGGGASYWPAARSEPNPAQPRANPAEGGVPNPANPSIERGSGFGVEGFVSELENFAGFEALVDVLAQPASEDIGCCVHGVTVGARCSRCGGKALANDPSRVVAS